MCLGGQPATRSKTNLCVDFTSTMRDQPIRPEDADPAMSTPSSSITTRFSSSSIPRGSSRATRTAAKNPTGAAEADRGPNEERRSEKHDPVERRCIGDDEVEQP